MADNKVNERLLVLNMLTETTCGSGFSHFLINKTFLEHNLDKLQKAFLTRLYLGTLEQLIFLDFVIDSYSSIKTNKMRPAIKNILRMSVYQMLFMDAVPDHAVINEAVKLANKKGFGNLRGFVNGVLRTVQRQGAPKNIPEHVKYASPKWIYDLCVKRFGDEGAKKFFESVNSTDGFIWTRLNLKSANKDDIIKLLKEDGCEVLVNDKLDEAIKIKGFDFLRQLKAYKKGLIFIQDFSSMNISHVAKELIDEKKVCSYLEDESFLIVDVCAAPGGKSLHMAEKFPNAFVYARDISKNKTDLIDENIKRLGHKNIQSQVFDARVFDETFEEKADIVLADLPCSGLGIIGQKPDIKLRVKEEDLKELSNLQKDILGVVNRYVKPGGLLIFSTCTINEDENEENTKWLLKNFDFELLSEQNFLPGRDDAGGFYIAALKRK